MAQSKMQKVKSSLLEMLKLDQLSQAKLLKLHGELTHRLNGSLKVDGAARKGVRTGIDGASASDVEAVVTALAKHPRKGELLKAGKEKDQLLRSLIPLYVARGQKVKINSGLISRFWRQHGVNYAAPNAAKALRNHEGYAKVGKNGQQITASGVKYVEAALQRRMN
ncbi:MAG TPA: hypothetical protein VEY30_00110 [Myxococcaceae bacterium]|nr:hypothetical protein [Myxococcaceae bacterium]